MKIALINGSPKRNGSASGVLSELLKGCIGQQAELLEVGLHGPAVSSEAVQTLDGCGAWVFTFPLYVDGVPSHLLSCLMELEQAVPHGGRRAAGIVNCGFFEGAQTAPAMEILENWCARSGAAWAGGVGVGGGGSLTALPKAPKGPMAPVCQALGGLTETLLKGGARQNQFVSVALPRLLYQWSGQMGWRKMIRSNGGKPRDLGRRL